MQQKSSKKSHPDLDDLIQETREKIKRHKLKNHNYIFLFIAFTLLLTSIRLITSTNHKLQTQPPPTAPYPTPIQTPTSDWKTYKNSDHNYEIKYPQDWQTDKVCLGGIKNDDYICLKSPDLELNLLPSVIHGQLITIGTEGTSVFPIGNLSPSEFCKENAPIKIRQCSEISVGQKQAIKKVFDNYPLVDVAIIDNNEIKFVIRLEYPYKLFNSSYNFSTFNQILSTFKFLD